MADPKILLLVEDEAIIAMGEKRLLEKEGYRVLHALDGEAAVELVREGKQAVDLILMDINLGPGMDGAQAARRILQTDDIPIVFLSSHAEKEIVEKTEEISSYGYVVKHSSPAVLLTSIKMALRLHDAKVRLYQSETRYRHLVEGSPDIVYTFSNMRGGVYYSPRVESILGYTLAYLYEHPFLWHESIHPEDQPKIDESIGAFEAGGSFDVEYRIRDARGQWRWLRDRSIGRYLSGDEVLVEGLATDITRQKQVEEGLRQSEQLLKEAQRIAHLGHWYWGIATNRLVWSDEIFHIFGVDPQTFAVSVENFEKAIHPDDLGSFLKERAQMLARKSDAEIHHRVVRPSGEIRYVVERARVVCDPAGQALFVMGTVQDVTGRKQAEERLRQSQVDLQGLFNATDESVILLDADETMLAVNDIGARRMGRPVDALIGHKASEVLPPRVYAHRHFFIQQALTTGQPVIFEDERDGMWMANRLYPILNEEGQAARLAVYSRDITEYKHTRDALRASDERFRAISETVGDMIAAVTTGGVITYINDLAARALNAAPQALAGQPLRDFFPGSHFHLMEQALEAVVRSGKPASYEFQVPLPTGRMWVEAWMVPLRGPGGEVVSVLCTARNIHQRKLIEESLRESEARLKTVTTNTPDVILQVDRQANITYINRTVPGQSVEEVIGSSIYQWVPVEQHALLKQVFEASFAAGEPGEYETLGPGPYGEQRTYRVRVMPVRVEEEIISAIYTATDITDRKLAEDRVKALLHEKELMLKEVHHRVKNNMNTITSLLNLQVDFHKDEQVQMALQDAAARVKSMMVLYDKLYRSQDFKAVSLQEYIPSLLEEVVVLFPHRDLVRIETRIEPVVLPSKLLSTIGIFLNELTTNAMKYAFPNRRQGVIRVEAWKEGQRVTIRFADDGVGLPEAFRMDSADSFGMQLIEILVQQLKGTIEVDGRPGARFTLGFEVK